MHLSTRACLLILAASIALAYANSLSIGYELDDEYLIVENPAVRSLENVPRFFVDPYTLTTVRENVDLRPMLQVTYALNYAVSGLAPWSWHLLAIALHMLCAALVFLLLRDHLWRGSDATGGALLGALLFALTPVNTQAVVYQSARSALLCTAFYLAAFFSHVKGRRALCAVFFALALLTKPLAVTLPLMIVAYELIYGGERARWKRLWPELAALCVLVAGYLAYRKAVVPAYISETFKEASTTPFIWLMTGWSACLYYVRQFLWPDGLSIDHEFPYTTQLLSARALVPLAIIGAWLGTVLLLRKRAPLVAFASIWFFIALAPESTLAPLAEPVNDHRPYLPSALGLAALAAWAVMLAIDRGWPGRFHRWAAVGVTSVLCVACGAADLYRNWQWQDSFRIWDDAAQKGPHHARSWMNAGVALLERGDLPRARTYLTTAAQLGPDYIYARMNLSALARAEGHAEEAIAQAGLAVQMQPGMGMAHLQLAAALELAGRRAEALAAYRHALELNPALVAASEGRARMSARLQEEQMAQGLKLLAVDPNAAAAVFEHVLELNPEHYGATYQLAAALEASGQGERARPWWAKSAALAEKAHDAPTLAAAKSHLQ